MSNKRVPDEQANDGQTFIKTEAKFALVQSQRGVARPVSVHEFAQMNEHERNELLDAGSNEVYRSGDTLVFDDFPLALVVTGIVQSKRLTMYAVDKSSREKIHRISEMAKNATRVGGDILGRRLYELRKGVGYPEPVPYQLYGQPAVGKGDGDG